MRLLLSGVPTRFFASLQRGRPSTVVSCTHPRVWAGSQRRAASEMSQSRDFKVLYLECDFAACRSGAHAPSTVCPVARQDYKFGPWDIAASEVFVTSPHSFAFVNLKPVVPGHVLVRGPDSTVMLPALLLLRQLLLPLLLHNRASNNATDLTKARAAALHGPVA